MVTEIWSLITVAICFLSHVVGGGLLYDKFKMLQAIGKNRCVYMCLCIFCSLLNNLNIHI